MSFLLQGIPVIIVQMARSGFDFDTAIRFANNLEFHMKKLNPEGLVGYRCL